MKKLANSQLSIMNYALRIMNCFMAFRYASGFPLYLCSLQFHLTKKFPLSVVRCLLSEKARKGTANHQFYF